MTDIIFNAEQSKSWTYEEGTYVGKIVAFEGKTARTGTKFYQMTLKGEGFGTFYHKIFDTYFGRADLFDIYTALGLDPKGKRQVEELLGKLVTFTIKEGDSDNNGNPTYQASQFKSADTPSDNSSGSDDDWENLPF